MAERVAHMRQTNGTCTKDIGLKMVLLTDQGGDPDASKSLLSLMIKGGGGGGVPNAIL
jgi:hypothetical protein